MKRCISFFVFVFITGLLLAGCGTKYVWPQTDLAKVIPDPNFTIDSVFDTSDSIHGLFKEVSSDRYQKYVEQCKSSGFTIITEEKSDAFTAYNEQGYRLALTLFSSNDLSLNLDAPIEMKEFTWPKTIAGGKVPKPPQTYGKIEWEHEDSFFMYIGKTTADGFLQYIQSCKDAGFVEDYRGGSDYYYANDAEGYHLSLNFRGFDTMTIRLDAPDKPADGSTNNQTDSQADHQDDTTDKSEAQSDVHETPAVDEESNAAEAALPQTPATESVAKDSATEQPKTDGENDWSSHSSGSLSVAKQGNSGVYAYKSRGGVYDNYYVIDFDNKCVYFFADGNNDEVCDIVPITSGDLNDVLIITYHDAGSTWSEGLHFKWKNHPDHLVVQLESGFESDYYNTNLEAALRIKNSKKYPHEY